MRRGLTTAEVFIASVVFVLSTVPVITLFLPAGRQSRLAPDYALALGLAHEAAEEGAARAWTDLAVAARLETEQPAVVAPAAAGGTSAKDGPVATLTGLRWSMAAKSRALPTTGEAVDVSTTFEWRTGGDERELTVAYALPRARATPLAPVTDEKIRELFYRQAPEGTLEEVVLRTHGDLPRIRALGVVSVALSGLTTGFAVPEGPVAGRARVERARALEAHAAARLQAMRRTVGPLGLLAGIASADLGAPPPALAVYRPAAEALERIRSEYTHALGRAADLYAQAASDATLPPLVRARAQAKAIRLAAMVSARPVPEPLAGYDRVMMSSRKAILSAR